MNKKKINFWTPGLIGIIIFILFFIFLCLAVTGYMDIYWARIADRIRQFIEYFCYGIAGLIIIVCLICMAYSINKRK